MLILNRIKRLELINQSLFIALHIAEGYYYVGISCSTDLRCIDEYSGVFNTEVTKQSSLWVSTGWVQLSAFAVCVAAWLLQGGRAFLRYGRWRINTHFLEA